MSRPVIQLDPSNPDYAAQVKRLAILAGLEITDEEGRLLVQRLPDEIDGRLSVWGGTELALNEEVPANRELLISDEGRLIVGDATRYGGTDFLRRHRLLSRIPGHVPGNVSFVTTLGTGNLTIAATTSAGQYGVVWPDGTVALFNSGVQASLAVANRAPKTVRVFAASAGASLLTFATNGAPHALDLTGTALDSISAIGSNLTEFTVTGTPNGVGLASSASLKYADISGITPAIGSSTDLGQCPSLAIVRAVGVGGVVGTLVINLQVDTGNGIMSATALNRMMDDLGQGNSGEIHIYGHTGTAACDETIATAKGWVVIKNFV